eukprot:scaffold19118_cov129-Isochrysis_galbana.AAC.1
MRGVVKRGFESRTNQPPHTAAFTYCTWVWRSSVEHADGVGDADANVCSAGLICAICLWWLALQM